VGLWSIISISARAEVANMAEGNITVNLAEFRGKCPACCTSLSGQEIPAHIHGGYDVYTCTAALRFPGMSLPLCYGCWYSNSDTCNQCALPVHVAFSSELGNYVMRMTTLVPEASQSFRDVKKTGMLCRQCHTSTPSVAAE